MKADAFKGLVSEAQRGHFSYLDKSQEDRSGFRYSHT